MKATELMIGDWVAWNNTPSRVHMITSAEQIRLSNSNELTELLYSHELDFEPIPLTAEILEKNGFKKLHNKGTGATEETYDYITNGLCVREFVEDWKDHYFVIRDTQISFNHVHELQHALRLLEYNELADNFKI